MDSQRKVPRKSIEKPMGILVQGHYHMVKILQVGEGGLMLDGMDMAFGENDRMLVTFSLNGDDFILVKARVKYRLKDLNRYGLEFENLQFQNKREIRTFVASNSKQRPHLYLVKS